MFAKLLKYEWKANIGLLGLLIGCALGLGCVATLILRLLTGNWDAIFEHEASIILLIPAFLFLFVSFLGIMLYGASVQYILLYRFYKSRFTDEGYLMFTLPVKTHQLFLSSAVNMLIWGIIAVVVIIVSVGVPFLLGPVWPEDAAQEFRAVFADMSFVFDDILGTGYTLTSLLSYIAMSLYSIVVPMSAVVIGASVAKKHKVLTIIGILIGISVISSTITGTISGIAQLLLFTADNIKLVTTIPSILTSIMYLGFTIGGYFLSTYIMKHRLNLP